MRHCERCDTALFELGQEPLCEECLIFMGRRTDPMDRVCFVCGDHWHHQMLPMCQNCYLEEGGAELAH